MYDNLQCKRTGFSEYKINKAIYRNSRFLLYNSVWNNIYLIYIFMYSERISVGFLICEMYYEKDKNALF